ncbi:hypothetical protein SKAU_G00263020 [Synaphobranchus kaupii]|uniref:RNA 2-O ribose methyltransferase substrate binding domain-containing protein n=1 Tax=Synaphobranchus kaupii TaxID=118154 RepID=A0A9Q1IMQ8_SYNKA|nr:hypothetical protein SKAU_G00263020 [Synaphobranchus kaupii]
MAAFMRSMGCRLFSSEITLNTIFMTVKQNPCIDLKRYVRALRRRPVKVLYPENEAEKRTETNVRVVDQRSERHQTFVTKKPGAESSTKNKQKAEINEISNSDFWRDHKQGVKATTGKTSVDDELAGLRYEKAFPGDKRLARAVSVARSRKFREQQGKVLLEGRRLICDALAAGAIPQMIFFSTVERLRELPLDKLRRASLVKVKFEDIKIWSDLVTPQGVMAIFSRPDASRLVFPQDQRSQLVPLYLVCDNVRDPGNVGTILRSAAAAGCHSVLLTTGCVDVWEPKVLRAAMGAHFRIPIIPNLDWEVIPNYLPTTATVHLADNRNGMETDGDGVPSGPLKKAGDYGWVSSRPNHRNVRYEEYGAVYESDSDDEEEHPKLSLPAVESQLYHENWAQSHTALVIGGETHGLSLEALQLAERTDGRRLFVPMVTGVDSLNSAMATSILVFEGRRQLTALAGQSGEKSRTKMP